MLRVHAVYASLYAEAKRSATLRENFDAVAEDLTLETFFSQGIYPLPVNRATNLQVIGENESAKKFLLDYIFF